MKRLLFVLFCVMGLFFLLSASAFADELDYDPSRTQAQAGGVGLDAFVWIDVTDADLPMTYDTARCAENGWGDTGWRLHLTKRTCVCFKLADWAGGIYGDYFDLVIDQNVELTTPQVPYGGTERSEGKVSLCLDAGTHFIEVRNALCPGDPSDPSDYEIEWQLHPKVVWPADIWIECHEPRDPLSTGEPEVKDGCGVVDVWFSDTDFLWGCNETGYIERMWFVEDACGTIVKHMQMIEVYDKTPPLVEIVWPTQDECLQAVPAPIDIKVSTSDNCGDVNNWGVDVYWVKACMWEALFWASDDCGNYAETFVQFIVDDTPPAIECPIESTVACHDADDPDFMKDPANTGGWPLVHDDCTPMLEIKVWWEDDRANLVGCEATGQPGYLGFIVRTWYAEDCSGNQNACQQLIHVIDKLPPKAICPDDVTVECDASTHPDDTGYATAVDNCDPNPMISYQDVVHYPNPACPNNYVIHRAWIVEDNCGNQWGCHQMITVVDTTPPVITINVPVAGACYQADPTPDVVVTDNCDPSPVVQSTQTTGPGLCEMMWTIEAWDCSGNYAVETVIYVVDAEAPVITINAPVAGFCYQADPTPDVVVTDNCDPAPTIDAVQSSGPGPCELTWTIKATDCSGNEAVKTVTYVVDAEAPVITINVPADGACYMADPTPDVLVTDNCDPAPVVVAKQVAGPGQCEMTWTITATDCSGNTSTATTTYIVDSVAPVVTISAPADGGLYTTATVPDASFEAVDACVGVLQGTATGYSTAEGEHTMVVTAEDCAGNVGTASVTYLVDNTPPVISWMLSSGECYDEMPVVDDLFDVTDNYCQNPEVTTDLTGGPCNYTLTVKVKDMAGNMDEQSMAFVVDNTPPVITITEPVEGACYGEMPTGVATATDDCDPAPVVTVDAAMAGDGCEYSITVKAVDACGNESSKTVTFMVDMEDPTVEITAPEDGACYTSENVPAAAYTMSDNCGATVVEEGYSTAEGVQTYKVTATDCAGNMASDSVTYIVDNTPPVVEITSPADGAVVNETVAIAADVTDPNLTDVAVFVGGEQVADSLPFDWDTTTYLNGFWVIKVEALDCAGNMGMAEITVEVDNLFQAPIPLAADAPILGVGAPLEVTLMGLAADEAQLQMWIKGPGEAEFRVDGRFGADECGHWQYTFTALEPGVYQFKIGGHDVAGNWAWSDIFELEFAPGQGFETVMFQEGAPVGTLGDYEGTADTWMGEWEPDQNNGSQSLAVRYAAERNSLLSFDLTNVIPADVSIAMANLGVYCIAQSNINPMALEAFGMKAAWTEDGATYMTADGVMPWEVAGANGGMDREMLPADSTTVEYTKSWYSFGVTDMVADWYADPAANTGVLLKGTADVSVQYDFASSEYPDVCRRPVLFVIFTTGAPLLELDY